MKLVLKIADIEVIEKITKLRNDGKVNITKLICRLIKEYVVD